MIRAWGPVGDLSPTGPQGFPDPFSAEHQNRSDVEAAGHEEGFTAWLRGLAEELDAELDAEPHSADVHEFLWTEFTRNGAMPAPYFAPLLVERRRALAQRAVEALLENVRRDTGRALTVEVTSEAPSLLEPAGHVSVGGETIQGIDPSDVFVETAEGLQCLLADRDRLIWPMCPEHRVGAHAMRTEAGAVWMCSVTSHEVAPIML
ncbi:hypothetical protein AB0O42_29050 [Streptomyces sp. NPDC089922]|uniref:hypothetical protein n=1 Tax=Streptomyces sp. NPDC089922 TaxID=3155189 RepID=UPI00343E72D1